MRNMKRQDIASPIRAARTAPMSGPNSKSRFWLDMFVLFGTIQEKLKAIRLFFHLNVELGFRNLRVQSFQQSILECEI